MQIDISFLQVLSGGFALVLGFVGYSAYIRGIVQGKIKPHAFSWLVWGILTGIGFVAQVVDGGGPGAWVTGFTAAMSFIFVIVGLGKSSRVLITRIDWLFFAGALVAIVPWYITGNPLWSVILITIIDAVAFIPTFRKAYAHPETESVVASTLQGSKFIFGIAALQSFSIVTVLYPASLILMNGAFVVMLISRRGNHPQSWRSQKTQQNKEKILTLFQTKESVTNNDIEKLLGVSDATATRYLSELEREGKIVQIGKTGRGVEYRMK